MILEREKQLKKNVYLCFIEYANAFDNIRYREQLEMLGNVYLGNMCE